VFDEWDVGIPVGVFATARVAIGFRSDDVRGRGPFRAVRDGVTNTARVRALEQRLRVEK
jgi:hypothetical protein